MKKTEIDKKVTKKSQLQKRKIADKINCSVLEFIALRVQPMLMELFDLLYRANVGAQCWFVLSRPFVYFYHHVTHVGPQDIHIQ